MKKKIIIALTACLFAAGSIINMHLAQNNHNTDISLADISVMAQADPESPPIDCGDMTYIPHETLRHSTCIPLIWQNYLKCDYHEGVCCDPSAQTTCSWN